MNCKMTASMFVLCLVYASCGAQTVGEKDKGSKKEGNLLVVGADGKEVKLTDWRFTSGTRRFALATDGKPAAKGDGPEYLEFRELKSTTYKNGIFTLVPLTNIKKINYDREKKTVSLTALADGNEEVTLTGSTAFTSSNRLGIEAETQLGDLGAATVKFSGGGDKGVQSITYSSPRPADKVQGTVATIIADDKEKSKHPANDVQALYVTDGGGYCVMPIVHFKKTVKINLDKIASMRFVQADKKSPNDYEVTLKSGEKHTLSLLTTIEADKQRLTFVGLIGRVPVGYKLFSLDAIYEYRSGEEK